MGTKKVEIEFPLKNRKSWWAFGQEKEPPKHKGAGKRMKWNIIGYLLIFGAGFKFFATIFSILCYNYVALTVLKIQPTLLGSILLLIYGWSYSLFEVWLGVYLIKNETKEAGKK